MDCQPLLWQTSNRCHHVMNCQPSLLTNIYHHHVINCQPSILTNICRDQAMNCQPSLLTNICHHHVMKHKSSLFWQTPYCCHQVMICQPSHLTNICYHHVMKQMPSLLANILLLSPNHDLSAIIFDKHESSPHPEIISHHFWPTISAVAKS